MERAGAGIRFVDGFMPIVAVPNISGDWMSACWRRRVPRVLADNNLAELAWMEAGAPLRFKGTDDLAERVEAVAIPITISPRYAELLDDWEPRRLRLSGKRVERALYFLWLRTRSSRWGGRLSYNEIARIWRSLTERWSSEPLGGGGPLPWADSPQVVLAYWEWLVGDEVERVESLGPSEVKVAVKRLRPRLDPSWAAQGALAVKMLESVAAIQNRDATEISGEEATHPMLWIRCSKGADLRALI